MQIWQIATSFLPTLAVVEAVAQGSEEEFVVSLELALVGIDMT